MTLLLNEQAIKFVKALLAFVRFKDLFGPYSLNESFQFGFALNLKYTRHI